MRAQAIINGQAGSRACKALDRNNVPKVIPIRGGGSSGNFLLRQLNQPVGFLRWIFDLAIDGKFLRRQPGRLVAVLDDTAYDAFREPGAWALPRWKASAAWQALPPRPVPPECARHWPGLPDLPVSRQVVNAVSEKAVRCGRILRAHRLNEQKKYQKGGRRRALSCTHEATPPRRKL